MPDETSIRIHLSGPDIDEADLDAVEAVLRSRRLALGPRAEEFEAALAEVAGRKHAVAVNSGTSALYLLMRAYGIGPGDKVVTSPFSFVASSNCILMTGAEPVFVDMDERTCNISVEAVERYLRGAVEPPKAVLVVDVFGQPSDWTPLEELCANEGIRFIEDSCEAIGSVVAGRKAGSFGDSAAFAFYPNKQITTGEGGCVLTDDEETAALCRSLANQGRGGSSAWLQHERLGYNFRISEINCALGASQLGRLDRIVERRAEIAARYSELLSASELLRLPYIAPEVDRMSWFVYVVRLDERFSRSDRDAVISRMADAGIACSNYFAPIHLMPFYREAFGFEAGDFPVTEAVSERTIALPFHNRLSEEEQQEVAERLLSIVESL